MVDELPFVICATVALPLVAGALIIALRNYRKPASRMDATVIGTLLASFAGAWGAGTLMLSGSDVGMYNTGMVFLVSITTVVGVLSLGDTLLNPQNFRGMRRLVPLAGALLLASPLVLLFRLDTRFLIPILVFSGIVLAGHGYFHAWTSPRRGALYLLASALVMALAPFIVVSIAEAIALLSADKVVYATRFVGCHLPVYVPPVYWMWQDAPQNVAFWLGTASHGGLLAALHATNRRRMLEKLAAQGHIPPDIKLRLENLPYSPPPEAGGYLDRGPRSP